MSSLLNGILQTINTNSSHQEQPLENVFHSVSVTAGWLRVPRTTCTAAFQLLSLHLGRQIVQIRPRRSRWPRAKLMLSVGSLSRHRQAGREGMAACTAAWAQGVIPTARKLSPTCPLKGWWLPPNTHLQNSLFLKSYSPGPFPCTSQCPFITASLPISEMPTAQGHNPIGNTSESAQLTNEDK